MLIFSFWYSEQTKMNVKIIELLIRDNFFSREWSCWQSEDKLCLCGQSPEQGRSYQLLGWRTKPKWNIALKIMMLERVVWRWGEKRAFCFQRNNSVPGQWWVYFRLKEFKQIPPTAVPHAVRGAVLVSSQTQNIAPYYRSYYEEA